MTDTREQLVARRDAARARLESAVERVAGGDRSMQFNLPVLERAVERLDRDISRIDAEASPRIRQVRLFTTRGY